MRLRLNRSQLECFHFMITTAFDKIEPDGVNAKLLFMLVDRLNERIRVQLKKLSEGRTTQVAIKLSPEEQMAFYCWYRLVREELTGQGQFAYEDLLGQELVNEIDRVHA